MTSSRYTLLGYLYEGPGTPGSKVAFCFCWAVPVEGLFCSEFCLSRHQRYMGDIHSPDCIWGFWVDNRGLALWLAGLHIVTDRSSMGSGRSSLDLPMAREIVVVAHAHVQLDCIQEHGDAQVCPAPDITARISALTRPPFSIAAIAAC